MKKKYSARTLNMIQDYINSLQPFDERHSDVVRATAWFKTENWQMVRYVLRSSSVGNGAVTKIQHNQFFTHMEIFTADGYRNHCHGNYDMTFEEAYADLKKRSSRYFSESCGFEYNFKSDYHKTEVISDPYAKEVA
tara:strand:+ start:5356 stop:5763 length:408 start_codon:yes stop_codon:yes gene_type:complete